VSISVRAIERRFALAHGDEWRIGMTKTVTIVSLVLLWVLAAGCGSRPTRAQVHLKVFEVPTHVLRQNTLERRLYKVPGSAYSLSVVTPEELEAMLGRWNARTRLLAESTRIIEDWPGMAYTWVYSAGGPVIRPDAICSGGGAGTVGVRERDGRLEVRIESLVDHRGPQGQKLVESEIFYEHLYPEGRILLFHTPSNASGLSSQHHVIAFEAIAGDRMDVYGALYSRREPLMPSWISDRRDYAGPSRPDRSTEDFPWPDAK
jgi:hypothetical protein